MHGYALEQFLGHVFKILGVLPGNDHVLEAACHARQNLFLDAAHGQHPALKGDLAGHAQVCAHAASTEGRYEGRRERNASRGAILGRSAGGHVHMDVKLGHKGRVHAQIVGPTADVAQGSLGAFLHDVAELTGEGKAALALHDGGFHGEHFAARRSPGQTKSHAGHELLFLFVFNKARRAQQFFHIGHVHPEGALLAFGLATGQLAADGRQFAFKVAQASFARVFLDDLFKGGCFQNHVPFFQAVFLDLFGQQMLARYFCLFLHGVARQGNDFHAVAQGRRDGLKVVGRAQEHNL